MWNNKYMLILIQNHDNKYLGLWNFIELFSDLHNKDFKKQSFDFSFLTID